MTLQKAIEKKKELRFIMTIKFRFKLQKKNNFMKLNTLVKIFSFFKLSKKEIAVIDTRGVRQIDHIFLIK